MDGEGTRRDALLQDQKLRDLDQDLLIREFARDFGFLERDVRNYLRGRNLVPVDMAQGHCRHQEEEDS